MSTIHKAAVDGFTKGDLYEASRPSYTDEAVDRIIQEFQNIEQDQEVIYDIVELGAGTLKFTNLITKKLQDVKYLATEPSDGFYQTFHEQYPQIESLQCSASKIPLKDNSVKCVICAQCFHWFSDGQSMDEIKRVLIPNGKLILLWNIKDMRYDWVKTWVKMIREGQPPSPNYYTLDWRRDIDDHYIFRCIRDMELDGVEFGGNLEFLVQNIMSVSVVNALSDENKEKLGEKGYKNFKGSMNYQSSSYQNGYRSTSYTSRYCGYVDDNGSWYLTTNCNLRKQFICQKETDCLRGYFGESCNQTCNCYKSNCDRATGVCPYGCSRGWTGDECNIEKKPAEVAVYCMKESEREQYALIRMDLKSVDYDEIYIVDDNDTILCNKSVFTPDVDGIYNLKIDLLSNDSDCYPEVFEGKFKMTIRTEEIEGFLNAYDRKFELDCDWNGFEKMSRSKQQTLLEEPMAHLKGVGIEGRPENVRLVIQDPSTKTAISKIKIGAKIQLAMILDTRSSSMSAKGISPYNCKCSTSDGKISHALTDSNGCPLKNSPIYLLESDSTPSRVISNTFDAFTIEGRSDILFQCQFDYCFHSSPHSKCPNRCLYSRSRRLIRRSVNRLNGMTSAARITVHDN